MARIMLTTAKQITYWELIGLELRVNTAMTDPEVGPNARVVFIMKNDVGEQWRHTVYGAEAQTLLSTINTADFSSGVTFYERVLAYLVNSNVVDGTVSAT